MFLTRLALACVVAAVVVMQHITVNNVNRVIRMFQSYFLLGCEVTKKWGNCQKNVRFSVEDVACWLPLDCFVAFRHSKKMNCSFLSGNGYYTLEWLLGCLIDFGMCSGCVRDAGVRRE